MEEAQSVQGKSFRVARESKNSWREAESVEVWCGRGKAGRDSSAGGSAQAVVDAGGDRRRRLSRVGRGVGGQQAQQHWRRCRGGFLVPTLVYARRATGGQRFLHVVGCLQDVVGESPRVAGDADVPGISRQPRAATDALRHNSIAAHVSISDPTALVCSAFALVCFAFALDSRRCSLSSLRHFHVTLKLPPLEEWANIGSMPF